MNSDPNSEHLDHIAIIGMGCRYPKARNLGEFWINLRNGIDCISRLSDEELLKAGVSEDLLRNPNYVKANSILEDVDCFDATFFGFTPREAEIMDPQHRFFLEVAWETLEHGGYDSERYKGAIGVFAGASMNSYLLNNLLTNRALIDAVGGMGLSVGSNVDSLSARVSYKLNLRGPSFAVQSACSTSLVAIHLAVQSLMGGECDMALAGGSSIIFPQNSGYLYEKGGIFSSDGVCRPFDADSEGTVGGRGVGVVLLKRFEDALADGDAIHAIIRGSAVNNDGSFKVGFTAPSVEGQSAVITEALDVADAPAESISYVETHGTATNLGDPIEVTALTKAFRGQTKRKKYCAIGSLKSNIGHADTAAGVGGLIKTVLALKHKQIPPSLHYKSPNPEINFEDSPFFVNNVLRDWPAGETPRRAGVSSFGIGGTNAHIIVEETPVLEAGGASRPYQLLLWSTKGKSALQQATENLAGFISSKNSVGLPDLAYTLQIGRHQLANRRFLVSDSVDDAANVLKNKPAGRMFSAIANEEKPHVVFMFSGQGAQYVNMGKGLYETEADFKQIVDECCAILQNKIGFDLRDILFPVEENDEVRQKMKQTSITQPALFIIEYALAKLWNSWAVHADSMIGHSIGEYVAACLAGVFSMEEALLLVTERGRLMQSMQPGSMLAVPLPAGEASALLQDDAVIAAINSPSLCVVSGTDAAIDATWAIFKQRNIECRRLHTSHAFHSAMMEPMLTQFTEVVKNIGPKPPNMPFISNLTGSWITASQATDPAYWAQHLRQPVLFADGVTALAKSENVLFLEIGPGKTLCTLAKQTVQLPLHAAIASMRHIQEETHDCRALMTALGQLWLNGVDVDWNGYYQHEKRRRVPAPTYAFQRRKYWVEPQSVTDGVATRPKPKKSELDDWFYLPAWRSSPLGAAADFSNNDVQFLVFEDQFSCARQLKAKVADGNQVISVVPGDSFAKLSEQEFVINPESETDYQELMKNPLLQGQGVLNIIYLWSLTKAENETSGQINDFYKLLTLARALGEQQPDRSIKLIVASNGANEVFGEAVTSPWKSAIAGPCRVIPLEYTGIVCRNIDISVTDNSDWENIIDALVTEFCSTPDDSLAAYRNGQRWVEDFSPVRLSANSKQRFRKEGVYLITGGMGGIGLSIASFLASKYQARLALLGRGELPERSQWPSILTTGSADSTSRKIQAIQDLEKSGAVVKTFAGDVADKAQMQKIVVEIKKQFGEVNGIVHTAGVAGGGIIQMKTREAAEKVLRPKLQGSAVLAKVFHSESLDFIALCSSLASTVGGFGQVDYCAANAFLDSYAQYLTAKTGVFTVSIDWDTWSESGMAVETEVPTELRKEREEALRMGITDEEGQEAFARIVNANFSRVLVSTRDFKPRILEIRDSRPGNGESDLAEQSTDEGRSTAYERPELSVDYEAPSGDFEQSIAEIWSEMFGIDKVGVNDNFFELGGHSLLAAQLLNRISAKFGQTKLSLRILFEKSTVRELAVSVQEFYGDARSEARSLVDVLQAYENPERNQLLQEFLRPIVAKVLQQETDAAAFPANGDFPGFELDSVAKEVIWHIRKELQFRLYAHEIVNKANLSGLAEFVLNEFDKVSGREIASESIDSSVFSISKLPTRTLPDKNSGMIFLLSAPRSGSTLMRLMLAGHSKLFCPPELGLLGYPDIKMFADSQKEHVVHGGYESPLSFILSELGADDKLFPAWLQRNASTQELFRELQYLCVDRTLIDKSPSYALNADILAVIEQLFDKPKYIHLVRHPYAMIDSAVRYRLQVYFNHEKANPYLFADTVWTLCNSNLVYVEKNIESERFVRVKYEDLVGRPEQTLQQLCGSLGLSFEKAMLNPYQKGRMIEGPGDLNILGHDSVDAGLGAKWKTLQLPRSLSAESAQLARELGYELPYDEVESSVTSDMAGKLLEDIDSLSEKDMDQLLKKMMQK